MSHIQYMGIIRLYASECACAEEKNFKRYERHILVKNESHMKTPFMDYKFNHGSGWPPQLLPRDWLCHQTLASAYGLRRDSPPCLLWPQLILCSWAASPLTRRGPGPEERAKTGWSYHMVKERWAAQDQEKGFAPFLLVFSSSCSTDHSNR